MERSSRSRAPHLEFRPSLNIFLALYQQGVDETCWLVSGGFDRLSRVHTGQARAVSSPDEGLAASRMEGRLA